ncbi:hypothetical protein DFS33DRAFT_809378 [Desarmillaria ectypa]|nr:hypothetical protein DFS33DRAFT_809378 [Desarmillaria ectypa]
MRRSTRNKEKPTTSDDANAPTSAQACLRYTRRTRNPAAVEESLAIFKTRRGRRAQFFKSQLADVPLEIYLEIFSYLDPVDLLRLARTTKHFRSFLMSRSVLSLWKRARSYVAPLPDIFPLTSEIIDFMFEKGCNYCASDENSCMITMPTTRACKKCVLRLHASESELLANSKTSGLYKLIQAQHSIYFIEPRLVLEKEYDTLNGDQPAIFVWMREKREELNSYRWLIERARAWWNKQELKAKDDVVANRLAEVNRRLATLGWGEELARLPSHRIADHKLVKKSERLTEKAWARIEPVLVDILQKHKGKRLLSDRFNEVRNILSSALKCHLISTSTSFAPDYVSLAAMEDCKRILDATPLDQMLTEDSFSPVLTRLAEIVDEWRTTKESECLAMLRQATNTDADLYLATTVFQCLACKQPVMYPKVLAHQCEQLSRQRFSCPQNIGELPWLKSQKLFRFHKRASGVSRAIVITCDLDPRVTTYVHMNTLHPLLECFGRHDFGRLVLRWQQALVHAPNHSSTPQFALLEGKDKNAAESIEGIDGVIWQDIYNEGFNRFRCSLCSEICEASILGHHLENCHPSFTEQEFARKLAHVTNCPLPDAFISLLGSRRRPRTHE